MFKKLIEKSTGLSSENSLGDLLKNVDLAKVLQEASAYAAKAVSTLPESEKSRLNQWVRQVREIRSSASSTDEKCSNLERLDAPGLVVDVFKSQIQGAIGGSALQGASKALSLMELPGGKLMGLAVKKAVPRLLVLDQAESFLTAVEKSFN